MSQNTGVQTQKKTVVERVRVDYLHGDREVPFSLYKKETEKQFNLFKRQGDFLQTGELLELANEGVATLYINTLHRPMLDSYLSNYARLYISDNNRTVETRCTYLYDSATQVLKRFFQNPEQGECLKMVSTLAENTMDMVLAEPTAFQSLLRVSSHDYYTFSHSVDVMIYAIGLGKRLGLAPERLKKLAIGSALHDIGKSQIDTNIINKQGRLSEGEFSRMMEHSLFGGQMLMMMDEEDSDIYTAVVHHHERFNGTGYPSRLKGDEIPLLAQIVGICDVFAALSTRRSYKDALKTFEALRIMRDEMSGHFNPELLKEFVQLMGRGA